MNTKEFGEWLKRLVAEGRLTKSQAADLAHQRRLFDANRAVIEAKYGHRVVGYCAGSRLVGDSFLDLMRQIDQTASLKGRQLYYEQV